MKKQELDLDEPIADLPLGVLATSIQHTTRKPAVQY